MPWRAEERGAKKCGLLAAPQLRDGASARAVAAAMGAELGWSRREVKRAVEAWPAAAAEAGLDPAGSPVESLQ